MPRRNASTELLEYIDRLSESSTSPRALSASLAKRHEQSGGAGRASSGDFMPASNNASSGCLIALLVVGALFTIFMGTVVRLCAQTPVTVQGPQLPNVDETPTAVPNEPMASIQAPAASEPNAIPHQTSPTSPQGLPHPMGNARLTDQAASQSPIYDEPSPFVTPSSEGLYWNVPTRLGVVLLIAAMAVSARAIGLRLYKHGKDCRRERPLRPPAQLHEESFVPTTPGIDAASLPDSAYDQKNIESFNNTVEYLARAKEGEHPSLPRCSTPWSLGAATGQGAVRARNEDCVEGFDDRIFRSLVGADGMGGAEFGQLAAQRAVAAAREDIIDSAKYACRTGQVDPQAAASRACCAAWFELRRLADLMNLCNAEALRTTLMIVIIAEGRIGWSYIGDGQIVILRNDGQIEQIMRPQKGGASNILWASLGPVIDGGAHSGESEWHPGDVVILGTDGCFDRVGPTYPLDLIGTADDFNGDLQRCVEFSLKEMTEAQTPNGQFIFADNITLAIAGSGQRPGFLEEYPEMSMPKEVR
jgi:serine/threonine protein phosphatase PrpC